jgi:hypothetical protein
VKRPSPRLAGRWSLLVLSVTLASGAGLPGNRDIDRVEASPARDASVGREAADAAFALVDTPMPIFVEHPPAVPPRDASAACDLGAGTGFALVAAHRDDVAVHPEQVAPGLCPVAGPKRVLGLDRRATAIAGAPPAEPKAVVAAAATPRRWSGSFNLYRKTAFVTQKDFTWCVAASVQMMANIVRHRSDRTAATQRRMISFAQASDHGPWGPGGGTDVTGWIAALRHFGAGKYRAVGARSPAAALRIAATAMRQTGRPAGMLVMEGRHAWVLHGFESRTDPGRNRYARISSVRVSGPLYPIQQKNGYDQRPNKELSVRSLARFFTPSSVGALVGKYVVIVPVH